MNRFAVKLKDEDAEEILISRTQFKILCDFAESTGLPQYGYYTDWKSYEEFLASNFYERNWFFFSKEHSVGIDNHTRSFTEISVEEAMEIPEIQKFNFADPLSTLVL